MTLPSHGPTPPYLMAAAQLRTEIHAGRLKPGDRLPSSRELKDSLGIANATVHAALRVLREEGLIYSVQGRGTYVADTPTAIGEAGPQEGADAGTPTAEGESTDTTALLLAIRDQMREMSAQLDDLTRDLATVKKRVRDLERKSAPEGR